MNDKLIRCPSCKTKIEWTVSNTERPFCSKRCKNSDFIEWANEERTILGNSSYDDIFSENNEKIRFYF